MGVKTIVSAPLGVVGEYPSHDNNLGFSGFHIVRTIADRDAIWSALKDDAMIVHVLQGAIGSPQTFKWDGSTWSDYELGTQDIPIAGITLINKDGSTTVGITSFKLDGLSVTGNEKDGFVLAVPPSSGSGLIRVGKLFSNDYQQYDVGEINIAPPLELIPLRKDKNSPVDTVGIQIKPATFQPMSNPAYLAYLQYPVIVEGRHNDLQAFHKGSVWFDMVSVPAGPYIQLDINNKAIGLQDWTNDDPNVTGGVDWLVWPVIYLYGNAPDDGYVEIVFFDKVTGNIAVDVNSHPMAVRHNYKRGDELTPLHSPITFAQVINAKGLEEYKLAVIDSFDTDVVKIKNYAEAPSGICIQALGSSGISSDALVKMEIDTGFNIRPQVYYVGTDFAGLDFLATMNIPAQQVKKGAFVSTAGGVSIYACEDMQLEISNGIINFSCVGQNICDFYISADASAEIGRIVAGLDFTTDVAIEDKDDGWVVGYFAYDGSQKVKPPIFSSRKNSSIILNKGWTKWGEDFISEDAVSGIHSASFTSNIPKNVGEISIAMYPVQAQNPMTLKLRKMTSSLVSPQTRYEINELGIVGLQHLDFMSKTTKLSQTTQGYSVLRYTINNAQDGLPMPFGIGDGLEYLTLDKTKNVIAGSMAKGGEGALVSSSQLQVTTWQSLQLYNEQSDEHTVDFWLMIHKHSDNTDTEVAGSRTTFSVDPKRAGVDYFTTNKVTFTLEPNDYFYSRSSADVADGAYLQTSQLNKPSVITYIVEQYLG